MTAPLTLPIAVMSFNRPDMLALVLQSLARQAPAEAFRTPPMLFQDGADSPVTGARYADPADLAASVAVFRRYFPLGRVFDSRVNLGVALNFDRAERILFDELGAPAALFLEDDMVLQPHYLQTIEALIAIALRTEHVGVVSGYGRRIATPLAEQRRRRRELCPMGEHNWAFAVTAACWRARDRVIAPWLEIMRRIDYRDRGQFKTEIEAFQRALGRGGRGYLTSQDSIKNLACEALGLWRLTTFTNNARYVGAVGEHMTQERFEARGYARTVLFDGPHDGFDLPDAATWARLLVEERAA